ncbi:MAG: HAMP domain-containing histidine kinase [Cytophagaceae bacterium]|jgi:hypothetical protein|nr:HAMP domain-containing histidine kinase [Cytophagaceae bacterium]
MNFLKEAGYRFYIRIRNHCRLEESPRDELRRAYFTYQLIWTALIIVSIFIPVNIYFQAWTHVYVDLFMLGAILSCYAMLVNGFLIATKLGLVFFVNIGVFIVASGHNRNAGYQFLWFVTMGGVFLLFPVRKLFFAIIAITISIFFFSLAEFTDLRILDTKETIPEFSLTKYYTCLIVGIGFIIFYLYYYMKLYHDSEKKLIKFVNKLIERNRSLSKTNNELDSFVYKASHDLRAPLASLMALVKLSKEERNPEMLQEYVFHQEKAIQKLDAYIVDILNISKNARKTLEVSPIRFKELLDDILSQYAFHENFDQIEKIIDVQEALPLYSDRKRILVILNNLISNALRYSDKQKKHSYIDIQIHVSKELAQLTIKDNGVGISKKHLPNIFEMFYRASMSSEGSGLGLYLVHETVTRLGGEITVDSEESLWTQFSITLPNHIGNPSAGTKA